MKRLYFFFAVFGMILSVIAKAQTPVEFVENKGQWKDWVKFKAKTIGGQVHLENDGFRYILEAEQNARRIDSFHVGLLRTPPIMRFHVYKVTFEGCRKAKIKGLKPQKIYYNYFLGNDSSKWKSGIHPDQAVDYVGLYKGIDLHLSSEKGQMVYEFIVQSNADCKQIKMNFEGTNQMELDAKGNLLIQTSVGQVEEMQPIAFQYINDDRIMVPCKYHLNNNQVTFDFPEGYNRTFPLIIDPTVVFCSFTGSTADNWGFTATYDKAGDFYTGGLVNAIYDPSIYLYGGNYPVTPGAYQSTFGGGEGGTAVEYGADVGIMKFNPTGTSVIWATYLGGINNERPFSMITDSTQNLIVVGRTKSPNFPVTAGSFQTTQSGGWDYFITKFNAACTGLIGSTYLGGSGDDGVNFDSTEVGYGSLKFNYGDDSRSEVKIDQNLNIYFTGCTMSTNFPTTPGTALSTTLSGSQDGIVIKMNPTLTTMIWGTYLSGSNDDAGYVITFNNEESAIYVAGGTASTDFPVTTTTGGWEPAYMGDLADGYILKFLNSPPYTLLKGTFVGTANYDQVYGIQVDNEDNVYVMGQSIGGAFPVVGTGVYTNPNSCQFIMKIDSNLTTDLISTIYGSGTTPTQTNISPVAFLVDTCENVYISGWGGNLGLASAHEGSCTGMPITADAYQSTTDGYDFYFMVLGPGMTTLRYGSYYGRYDPSYSWEGEHVDGGTSRFDKNGIIYQGICANCGGPTSTPFPTTAGVWAPSDSSQNCNEASLKIAFNIGPVTVAISVNPSTSGCAPFTVNFENSSSNVVAYTWNFGDGSTSTAFSPSHTFTTPGVFTVTVTGSNTNACFRTSDTQRLIIYVDTSHLHPGFLSAYIDSCSPYVASFTNTSVLSHPSDSSFTHYTWEFSSGGSYIGKTPPNESFPGPGTYTVTMIMQDTAACNSPDTVSATLTFFGPLTVAVSPGPDTIGCAPLNVTFDNTSTNVVSYLWNFGDGTTSTAVAPSHTFTNGGWDTVTFIGSNPSACNSKSDTVKMLVYVDTAKIYPSFSFAFVDSCGPFVISLANTSTQSFPSDSSFTSYVWSFGDGTSYTGKNPGNHNYSSMATYTVSLTMADSNACNSPQTVTKVVPFNSFFVSATFKIPDSVCLGTPVAPNYTLNDATSQIWYYGNGDSSFTAPSSINYGEVGNYTIMLIANNPGSCNGTDTVKENIAVLPVAKANFTFSPVIPVANSPITYTNLSINATSYLWQFGDNSTSTETNPVHLFNNSGSFNTCLEAYNSDGCPAKICKSVLSDIVPIIGIPSAFSPNNDGSNDILYVKGAAISTLDLRIWNRWGQMVFETTDIEKGWDGTFAGQPQPIDAYAYVLIVTFIDGTGKTLKGNITLLR